MNGRRDGPKVNAKGHVKLHGFPIDLPGVERGMPWSCHSNQTCTKPARAPRACPSQASPSAESHRCCHLSRWGSWPSWVSRTNKGRSRLPPAGGAGADDPGRTPAGAAAGGGVRADGLAMTGGSWRGSPAAMRYLKGDTANVHACETEGQGLQWKKNRQGKTQLGNKKRKNLQ